MAKYTGGPDYSRIQPEGAAGLLVVAMAFIAFGTLFPLKQTLLIVAVIAAGVLCLFPVMQWLRARSASRSQPPSLVPPNPSFKRTRQKRRAA